MVESQLPLRQMERLESTEQQLPHICDVMKCRLADAFV